MIHDNTLKNYLLAIKENFKDGTFKSILTAFGKILFLICLISIPMIVSLCTGGSFLTSVQTSSVLFHWMECLSGLIISLSMAIVLGLANFAFSFQNIIETFGLFLPKNTQAIAHSSRLEQLKELLADENYLQILNPFRLVTLIIHKSFVIVGLLLHVLTMAVIGDRPPHLQGISPEIITYTAIAVAAINDGSSDLHYFVDHGDDHEHGHDHSNNIPTLFINAVLLLTLIPLSTLYDYIAALLFNTHPLKLKEAWDKQSGLIIDHHHNDSKKKNSFFIEQSYSSEQNKLSLTKNELITPLLADLNNQAPSI